MRGGARRRGNRVTRVLLEVLHTLQPSWAEWRDARLGGLALPPLRISASSGAPDCLVQALALVAETAADGRQRGVGLPGLRGGGPARAAGAAPARPGEQVNWVEVRGRHDATIGPRVRALRGRKTRSTQDDTRLLGAAPEGARLAAECNTLRSVGWFGPREHSALPGAASSAQWDPSYPQGTSVVRVARRLWRAAA